MLRIDLRHIKPPVWRRIWVPADNTLHDLHRVIQVAMGWWDAHLHRFVINGIEYGELDPEYCFTEVISEHETRLKDVIRREKQKIRYEYDFGDDWEHDIVFERREKRDSRVPILLKGKRACPPEDCGGVYGYFRLIAVQKKVKAGEKLTEAEQCISEWMCHEFDPEVFDAEYINTTFAKMSRK